MTPRKIITAVVATGTFAVGSAGVAFAAGSSSSTPASSSCGVAGSARLAALEKVQGNLPARITRLQALESQVQRPRRKARVEARIVRLQAREPKVSARIAKLEARCPGLIPSAPAATPAT
jgi:hypothetical protein